MHHRRSLDVATVLAALVVLIVGLMAVALERGCSDAGDTGVTASSGPIPGDTLNQYEKRQAGRVAGGGRSAADR